MKTILSSRVVFFCLVNGIFAQLIASWVNPFIVSSNFVTTNMNILVQQKTVFIVLFNLVVI